MNKLTPIAFLAGALALAVVPASFASSDAQTCNTLIQTASSNAMPSKTFFDAYSKDITQCQTNCDDSASPEAAAQCTQALATLNFENNYVQTLATLSANSNQNYYSNKNDAFANNQNSATEDESAGKHIQAAQTSDANATSSNMRVVAPIISSNSKKSNSNSINWF